MCFSFSTSVINGSPTRPTRAEGWVELLDSSLRVHESGVASRVVTVALMRGRTATHGYIPRHQMSANGAKPHSIHMS